MGMKVLHLLKPNPLGVVAIALLSAAVVGRCTLLPPCNEKQPCCHAVSNDGRKMSLPTAMEANSHVALDTSDVPWYFNWQQVLKNQNSKRVLERTDVSLPEKVYVPVEKEHVECNPEEILTLDNEIAIYSKRIRKSKLWFKLHQDDRRIISLMLNRLNA